MAEESKTRTFTLQELQSLWSQIDFTNQAYITRESWQSWDNSKRADYILKLLCGLPLKDHPIELYDRNFQNLDIDDSCSLFNHHYAPTNNGIEELTAIYNYLGYYKRPEDEFDLNLTNDLKNYNIFLTKIQKLMRAEYKEDYHKLEEDISNEEIDRILGLPNMLASNQIPTKYSNLSSKLRDEIVLRAKTKVTFLPSPSEQTNRGRVHIGLNLH